MNVRPLSKPLQEKAEKELNEIPSQIEESLDHLRNWLSKQEHLKSKKDDQFLIHFLRCSKYSLQGAKEKLDAFYTSWSLVPEVSENLDPLLYDVQTLMTLGLCVPLPTPQSDPEGPRTFLISYGSYDPEEVTLITMMKAGLIMNNVAINEDDNMSVSGVNAIIDMKGLQFKTLVQLTPNVLLQVIYCLHKALPMRIKAVHVINVPRFAHKTMDMVKQIISKKLFRRVHIHSSPDWKSIYNDIPQSILPTEYGGQAGKLEDLATQWKKTVESHRDWLLIESSYYVIESKRPRGSNTNGCSFGIEGSFRKLEID